MEASDYQLKLELPRGETASFEDMQRYGEAIQAFVQTTEASLHEVENRNEYNEIVDYLNLLAESYNEQLGVYKAAEKERLRVYMMNLLMLQAEQER